MNERIKFVKEIIKEKQEEYDFLIETDKESANYILTDMKLYEEILKDLERLEILDKLVTDDCIAGNQVGLDIVNNLIERANKYKEKAKHFEKENQELKSKYNNLMLDFKMFDFNTLKQENEILKQSVKDTYDTSQEIIFDLKKENKELKENEIKINRYNSELIVSATNLEKENQGLKERQKDILNTNVELSFSNQKLKKAIEIIKLTKVDTLLLLRTKSLKEYNSQYELNKLTKQEYELLKEVLE